MEDTRTMARQDWSNWAGNQRSAAVRVAHPTNTQDVADLVQTANAEGIVVKPVGAGHSFTAAASTDGIRVALDRLTGPITVQAPARLVTVPAGIPLRLLNQVLAEHGLALPNLGDIDAQTLAGAISTGTHGTGARLGCLSTFVTGLTLVSGTGEIIHCSATERPEVFAAARVGVGALGVLTEVTLRCVDAFTLCAQERPERVVDVFAGLAEHIESNDFFEMYWFPYTDRLQTKRNNRVPLHDRPLGRFRGWLDDDFLSNTVFEQVCRIGRLVPGLVPGISAIEARALSARIYTAPSYQVFCTPRRVRFVEMEYCLPRAALREAFDGLRAIVDRLPFKVIFPVEMRFSAADDIWLSHGYGRDNAYLAIHQYVGMPYQPYFQAFEQLARELGGRPHWGKMHGRTAEDLRPAYPRFDDFRAVRDQLDPGRTFANSYTAQILGD
jgi:L-gulonolactone oxidase